MKKNDLSGFTEEQLKQQISEEKDRLVKLKFAHAITPIENPRRITETRKNIARLSTALNSSK
ncbi:MULTISPECIES: 50S ribosomal protein L29 [unclassified Lacihabitans]|jgi:large subunit ribosomal protein L29|uniref:50S ribosomal protein L29 n=1 Tax=unclassified Lacihabitans TaxID=2638817 RepID=UPI000BD3556E|nr:MULTISPECIES: 50S ribosomal protein L29 [unclassified Lacihabitans]MBP6619133.1 50S ribosomal protein L29 [Leadbetterella sp.]OYU64631.1 MAG: 50S ribosomal protein L29 [Cytophagaceae bacterium BCCC1]MCP9746308.1 50S ribosomal protein L29 [Lacihabitans sp. CS3-21]MCP9755851.1 50S ribosomal protein L29 [Lacihabitans sp. CCS-44]MDP1818198.1 50S ribosomal protein L29 [Leadbetterella sp.]